jgi:hypothetical protein
MPRQAVPSIGHLWPLLGRYEICGKKKQLPGLRFVGPTLKDQNQEVKETSVSDNGGAEIGPRRPS